MNSQILSPYLQKKTQKTKTTLYLCCLGSLLLSTIQANSLYKNTNEFLNQKKLENKEKKYSLFHVLFPLTTTILSIFLTFETIKYLKKFPFNKKRKTSVSKDVLNQLCYVNTPQNKHPSPFDPLTKKDIENLVQTIDFSALKKQEQLIILQNLIVIAHSSPLASKILKSNLRSAIIEVDKNLSYGGLASFSPEHDIDGKIIIQNVCDPLSITHEIFHLKQAQDGAFCLKDLHHYLHLMNEAQAKGLNYVLNFATNLECRKYNLSNETLSDWENTLYYSQFDKIKKQNPTLLERELQGKTEERAIGVLMKCLLEDDEKKREEIFNTEGCFFSSTNDRINFNTFCFEWRSTYINETVLNLEEKTKEILTHTPKIIQHEVDCVKDFNAYFSYETGIQQDIKNIKIATHDKNNALFQFCCKELEKE